MRICLLLTLSLTLAAGCSRNEPGLVETIPAEPAAQETSAEATSAADVLIIDVRTPGEWDAGHHDRAVHIPLAEVTDRIGEYAESKETKIVVYCAVGGRSGKAKEQLEALGYTNVENAGGLKDVRQAYP